MLHFSLLCRLIAKELSECNVKVPMSCQTDDICYSVKLNSRIKIENTHDHYTFIFNPIRIIFNIHTLKRIYDYKESKLRQH